MIYARARQSRFLLVLGLVYAVGTSVFSETEPNNTVGSANVVQVNTSEQGSLNSALPSDVYDCYQVTLPGDGMFQVGVVPTAELNVAVTLLDEDGFSSLGSKNDQGNGGTEGIVYNNLRAGTYYAVVSLVGGQGDYSIAFNFAPTRENDPEPNNTPAQAVPFAVGGEARGHIGYHGGLFTDIWDYYQINLPDDGNLELSCYPDGSLRIRLTLVDSDGTSWLATEDRNSTGQSEKIVYPNLASGMYYVLVSLSNGYGSYTLTSLFDANPDPNDAEPNDTTADAREILFSARTDNPSVYEGTAVGRLGYFGNQASDDRDFYRIVTPGYGKLTLSFAPGSGDNVDLGYEIFDANLRHITAAGTDTFSLTDLRPGLYYINLFRESRFGAYTLLCTFEEQVPGEPLPEPSGDVPLPGMLTDILLAEDTPAHYLRIIVPADGRLVLRGQFTDARFTMALFDSDRRTQIRVIDSWGSADVQVLEEPNLRKGVYLVRLARVSGTGIGTLETQFTAVTKIDAEPNEDWTSLRPTSLNQSIAGHIGFHGDGWTDVMDRYLLVVPDDGSLTLTARSQPTVRYVLRLYSYHGSTLTQFAWVDSWGSADAQTITKPNILAGKYIVSMDRVNGYGEYDIDVKFEPNRSGDLEVNDHWYQSVAIAPGEGVTGHLGYERGFRTDVNDWFKVDLPSNGRFVMWVRGEGTLRYIIDLYNRDSVTRITYLDSWNDDKLKSISYDGARAGTYYILMRRVNGYGTYEFYSELTPQVYPDTDRNDLASMAQVTGWGEIGQGSLGYGNRNTLDTVDWYSVQVPAAGRNKLTFQHVVGLRCIVELYGPNMISRLLTRDTWGATTLFSNEIDLEPSTYYVLCRRVNGAGSYTWRLGDLAGTQVGSLSGKVTSSTNFPLGEIEVRILDWVTKTDFTGAYRFEGISPGTYRVTFSSGAKYYAVNRDVEIRAGQNTFLDVVMLETNTTAPADVRKLYGIARDRYVHLFWSPSVSPDVADGGGYKLYIDDRAPLDLGDILFYRSTGFENGRTYTFRLTVYDKYGNESQGNSIRLTPLGPGPAPTPTVPPPITPRPTPPPPIPSPTPKPTATRAATPTPTVFTCPTLPVPVPIEPLRVFTLDSTDEFMEFPGGFINAGAGTLTLGDIPGPVEGFTDGKGATISAAPGQVELLLFSTLGVGDAVVLLRATVQSTGPGASVALAALDGSMDGSIATDIPANSQLFMGGYSRMVLVFDPPGTTLIPVFQLANLAGEQEVTVYLDNIEVFLLPRERYPLFYGLPY